MGLTIGVDIGGTKVAAGVVDEAGKILARVQRATPSQDPGRTADVVAACVRELARDHEIEAVGLGAAGFVDAGRSTVLFAPNLAWRDEPLQASIEGRTGLPAVVENDANAAAWGETRFGAGNGQPFTVTLTIGTGIGGGVVLDGALVRGAFGLAAEAGHINVVPDGRLCGCGQRGCLEQYGSGRALVREARERAERDPAEAARLLQLAGGNAERITGPEVTQAAEDGDPVAVQSLRTVGTWIGHGMADLAAILDPQLFILAGGVCAAGELLAAPARASFEARLTGHGHRPLAELRIAELGPDAGMVGAADLARMR
jgi:glucokinase